MRPKPHPSHSWRADPAVPAFDETRILLVMDGECALCSGAARRIARWDGNDQMRIATVASPLGASLLAHFDMNPDDPTSWLMIEDGVARGSLDGMVALFPKLRWWLMPMVIVRVLPWRVQDWIYARIARNRYWIGGKGDLCAMPDPALRARLVG